MIRVSVQDLIVQLTRKNGNEARLLAESIRSRLGEILQSQTDTSVSPVTVQQTLFAIDEVVLLVGQNDLRGALDAARDAAKEWRAVPRNDQEQNGA